MDNLAAIRDTFFQECEEQLAELESGLLRIQLGDFDLETINAVFRAVHSIKGGAGAFKLHELVKFSHVFETTLDLLRTSRLAFSSTVCKVMLRAADTLSDLVQAAQTGEVVDDSIADGISAELAAFSGSASGTSEAAEYDDATEIDFTPVQISVERSGDQPPEPPRSMVKIKFSPKPSFWSTGNDPLLILRELASLGDASVSCDTDRIPMLDQFRPDGAYIAWQIELTTERSEAEVRAVFEFVEDISEIVLEASTDHVQSASIVPIDAQVESLLKIVRESKSVPPETIVPNPEMGCDPALPTDTTGPPPVAQIGPSKDSRESRSGGSPASQSTIRIELDRVDRLINLVGELVINQAMLSQQIVDAGFGGLSTVSMRLDELEQLTREIQESVMAIRAQPVKPLFQRMSRTVREVADSTGKSVRLITEGDATEVDKTVVERLVDPLTHMVRNAIDHGIEAPADRLAAGKPQDGTIKISASHRSGRVFIEVADDGAGINRKKVREIAERKGLIATDAQLTDFDIDNLLFLPGFSTAASVSSISGRGVGMDVVKRSVQNLGGRISISSVPGKGSTFSISVPLTLAILDGMIVAVGDQTLVIPLTAIIGTLRPTQEQVFGVGAESGVIKVRNEFVPLIDIGRQLKLRDTASHPTDSVAILVESEAGRPVALLVDRIQDQRQVVIKSLEDNYGRVENIAAATILGDGRVALIVDVDAVVKNFRGDAQINKVDYAKAG